MWLYFAERRLGIPATKPVMPTGFKLIKTKYGTNSYTKDTYKSWKLERDKVLSDVKEGAFSGVGLKVDRHKVKDPSSYAKTKSFVGTDALILDYHDDVVAVATAIAANIEDSVHGDNTDQQESQVYTPVFAGRGPDPSEIEKALDRSERYLTDKEIEKILNRSGFPPMNKREAILQF